MFLSKYGVGRHVYVPVVKRAVIDFAVGADWTPATGDVKLSKDGGAFANIGTLPSVIASANTGAVWDFTLTATEMQAAQVMIVVSDAATKAVEDQCIIIETYGHASAQHEFDLDTAFTAATTATAVWATAMSDLAAVPSATASVLSAVNWIFEKARNKITQTSSTETVFKDNSSSTVATSTVADDGTTFSRSKFS